MNFTFTWILDKFGFQPKVEIAPAKKVAVKKESTNPFDALFNKIVSEETFDFSTEDDNQIEPSDAFEDTTMGLGDEEAEEDLAEFDDEESDDQPAGEKRGRGRPAGSKSGANQKVIKKSNDYRGVATHSLNLPNTNK